MIKTGAEVAEIIGETKTERVAFEWNAYSKSLKDLFDCAFK